MITAKSLHIYLAAAKPENRSHLEDSLVLDGFEVCSFLSATALWQRFQLKPARLIITERRFDDGLTGLELAQEIRSRSELPYTYILMVSNLNHLEEIELGLDGGVDDYLLKPYNPFQFRSRILVAIRWLNFIDSLNGSRPANGIAKPAGSLDSPRLTISTI